MDSKRFDVFMFALTKSQKSISGLLKEAMREENIKHVEAICIKSIAFIDGGVSAGDLCKMCFYDKALISRTINNLKKNGYICVNPQDENKSRGRRYILTEEGKRISDKMSEFMNNLGNELTKDISDEDVETFFQTALKILDNIQNLSSKEAK